MSRLNKTEQIIELAMMFQNSYCGLCIDDIQEHFECSRRSAERMKALLFELFPDKVEEVPTNDKKKRWRFVKGTMNFLISFSAMELGSLMFLREMTNDESRKKVIDELIEKIKALTPIKKFQSIQTDIEAIMESEGFAVRQYSRPLVNSKTMEDLRNAMIAYKKVQFDYPTDKGNRRITLNPYGLIVSDKHYLVGYNEYVKDLRLYKVDKIANLEILDEYYLKDEKFSLTEYCKNSFSIYQEEPLKITLEFDKSIAEDVLNYHFHPTQKMKQLNNGNVQVKFTCGGKYAICHELFKWSCNVKIKKPAELREYYRTYLSDVLKNL